MQPPKTDLCNWDCYDKKYPTDLSSLGGDWESLKDHYFTTGKGQGKKCECDEVKLPVTLTVKSCGDETLSLTTEGNKDLFYHTSIPTTTSARL